MKKISTNKNNKKAITNIKSIKRGSYSMTMIILVIAIAAVLNLLVNALPSKYTQLDVSTEKLYTIGDETKEVLNELDEDITIYLVAQEGSEDNTILQLLKTYESASSHIKLVVKDPALYPGFTSNYTDETLEENSLIVVGDKNTKIINASDMYVSEMNFETYESSVVGFDGEGQVTSAIKFVTSSNLPKVYLLKGHNETDLDGELKSTIGKMNIDIEELNLLTTGEIPSDCAALLIMSPQSDFSENDANLVIDYLNEGGRALISTNYTSEELTNFNHVLNAYGMNLIQGVIFDPSSGYYAQQNPMYLVPKVTEGSTLAEGLRNTTGYVYMPITEGLEILDTETGDAKAQTILKTSDSSYLKTDPGNMESYTKTSDDIEGPFTVGASAYKMVSGGSYSDQAKVAVFTSASFMTASADDIVSGGNFTLIKDTMEWLVDEAEGAIAIDSKNMKVDYLTIKASTIRMWTIITVLLLPLAVFAIGAVIWFRRKNK